MKTAVVLLLALLAQAGGNVCLSQGMRKMSASSQLGSPAIVALLLWGLANPTLWLGMGLLGVFFGLYAAALSWADLSVVLPGHGIGICHQRGVWRLCLARSRAPGALGRSVADWPGHLLCILVGEASSPDGANHR